jgi:hypothetical protein
MHGNLSMMLAKKTSDTYHSNWLSDSFLQWNLSEENLTS